jgi:hypothetical protein
MPLVRGVGSAVPASVLARLDGECAGDMASNPMSARRMFQDAEMTALFGVRVSRSTD